MPEEKQMRRRKFVKFFFFKLPIALMIIGAVLIGALKLVERHPDPLRQGFEEYLSRATGRNATIGQLEEIKFFPNFIIRAKNITIHNAQNAAIIDLEVEEFYISSPFSSMFINGKKINNFTLDNLVANKGMLGEKEIEITRAEIITKKGPDQFGSFIIADGSVGKQKSNFEMELDVGKYNYSISSSVSFSLTVGAYGVNALLKRGFRNTSLENTVFSKGDISSIARQYILSQKKGFNEDNPLTCLLSQDDLKDCDKYLKEDN